MCLIIDSRKSLIKKYREKSTSIEDFILLDKLWPSTCARIRDASLFAKQPFYFDDKQISQFRFGSYNLGWTNNILGQTLINLVDLNGLELQAISICKNRKKFISNSIKIYESIFESELKFINEYTSVIVWVIPTKKNTNFCNAAFYDIPHVTFVSDGTLFFVPPFTQVPKEFAGYAFIENMYHEALHQKVHAHCALTKSSYCRPGVASPGDLLFFPQRQDRSFTISQAINACLVYRNITLLRNKMHQNSYQANGQKKLYWLTEALNDALYMWYMLSNMLFQERSKLLFPWNEMVLNWTEEVKNWIDQHKITLKEIEIKFVELHSFI